MDKQSKCFEEASTKSQSLVKKRTSDKLESEGTETSRKQSCTRQMTIYEALKIEPPKDTFVVCETLIDAVKMSRVSKVDELLKTHYHKYKSLSNQRQSELNDALIYAVSHGYFSTICKLMNHRAFILDNLQCIFEAIAKGHIKVVKYVLENNNYNLAHHRGAEECSIFATCEKAGFGDEIAKVID